METIESPWIRLCNFWACLVLVAICYLCIINFTAVSGHSVVRALADGAHRASYGAESIITV